MSMRTIISFTAIAALGIVIASADAFAARMAARGSAVAARGAVGVRGGALAYRGGLGSRAGQYGGYYRPGLGLAAGAVVGGALAAASSPGYGYGGYGYDSGYGYPGYAAAYGPANSYNNYGTPESSYASAGDCGSDGKGNIWCHGQCWLHDPPPGQWGDCPVALRVKAH